MTAPAFGDPVLNAWILAWGADRALHGFADFWTGLFFYPVPDAVALSEHLLGITLFTAPVQWASGNPVLAYNVAVIGATLLAGWGMFLLARELTGRADAAMIAGLAFACLPYRVPAASHLQVLMTGWMPVALWGLHRYLATSRRSMLMLFAAAFVLQAWSNGYYLYFAALPVSVIVLHALWTDAPARIRRLLDLTLAGAAILAALAPIAVAYLRVRRSTGFARTIQDITQYSAPLEAYVHVGDRLWLWGGILPRGTHELELFTGLTIVLLAAASLWWSIRLKADPTKPVGRQTRAPYAAPAARTSSTDPASAGLNTDPAIPLRSQPEWRATLQRRVPARVKSCAPDDNPPDPSESGSSTTELQTVVRLYAAIGLIALVLSLGPRPALLEWRLPFDAPYAWLLQVVPGLSGLRVPARLAVVVYLALGVLAAIGFAAVTRRWVPRSRAIAAAGCALVIVVEGYGGPVPIELVPTREMRAERPAYDWLLQQPPGAVLELPVGGPALATRYMYATLLHRHRIVNGYTGSGSAMQDLLGGAAFTELGQIGEALRAVRAIGVRYIVVHPQLYGNAQQGEALVRTLLDETEHVASVVRHGTISVALLRPLTVSPLAIDTSWRPIPTGSFTASASHNVERLNQAFDGNPQSRWLTGTRQQAREWIEVRFADVQDLARIRLDVERRSRNDYPRGLVVEISPDGRTFTSHRVHAFERLAVSLAENPARAGIDVVLPPNRTRVLRLRVTGETRLWFWSVDELRLFAR